LRKRYTFSWYKTHKEKNINKMKKINLEETIALQLINGTEEEKIWYYDDESKKLRYNLIYCPCGDEICCNFCDMWADFPEDELSSIAMEIIDWEARMEIELLEWLEECNMNDHEFYKDEFGEYQHCPVG
jgi:hypothetical protein